LPKKGGQNEYVVSYGGTSGSKKTEMDMWKCGQFPPKNKIKNMQINTHGSHILGNLGHHIQKGWMMDR
jgi:hypothetical protein